MTVFVYVNTSKQVGDPDLGVVIAVDRLLYGRLGLQNSCLVSPMEHSAWPRTAHRLSDGVRY